MKPISYKSILLFLIVILLSCAANPLAAQVYKTVDENGNVTYTDKPPVDGSKPIELRPISVIEAPVYEKKPKVAEDSASGEEPKQMSLKYLRKNYSDFAIVAPQSEETIWNPEETIPVAWNTRLQLQPGMLVTISVNGQEQAKTTSPVIQANLRDRGEHTVTAVLKDADNRTIATAEPVIFYIRQPGLGGFGGVRVRPAPHGGG